MRSAVLTVFSIHKNNQFEKKSFQVEQEQNQLPLPLLVILVFWITLLFVSFGLFSPTNATALT